MKKHYTTLGKLKYCIAHWGGGSLARNTFADYMVREGVKNIQRVGLHVFRGTSALGLKGERKKPHKACATVFA